MVYSVRIPKKMFYKVRELCKEYSSYRECIMKEIEKKYNFQIYNSKKAHDMRLEEDLLPKPIFIIFFDEENERLEELAKQIGKSKYEIIMSLFR
jgi:predicted DNA-binding protein